MYKLATTGKWSDIYLPLKLSLNILTFDTLKNLLRLRYLEFRKWEDIAYILNYSRRYIFKLHNKALKELNKKL